MSSLSAEYKIKWNKVLNTAARIQSKCNEYQVKILSSDELLQKLPYDNDYRRIQIGDIELKGKETNVALSTLETKQLI